MFALKKKQEPTIYKAFVDCDKLLIFVQCSETKQFLAVGLIINEPIDFIYLNVFDLFHFRKMQRNLLV